jgi:GNAT superfamily N-acetyltransferase
MWLSKRNFASQLGDFKKMCALVIKLNSESIADWSLGRIVDWRFGLWNESKQQDVFFEQNAVLWFNYLDDLTGFCLSEDGSPEFQMIIDRKYPILNQFMIDDLKTKYGTISTVCSQKDEVKKACLLRNGFRDTGPVETTFVYRADRIAFPNLESAGYTTIGMDEYGNIEEQIRLKNNAFNGGKALQNHEIAAYHYVKKSPIYDPSMDLVLLDENGKPVSGCEGFIDYANGIMEIERICTHENYRHRGLAKAVIAECIKRGLSRGVITVQITGWNDETCHLYGSFGEHTVIIRHRYAYDTHS